MRISDSRVDLYVPDLLPISYTDLLIHNQYTSASIKRHNPAIYADFLSLTWSKNSTLCGFISTVREASRSIASRFSTSHRASIAVASCSTHASSSTRSVLEKFAARLRVAISKSCRERIEPSSRKSSGGIGTDNLPDSGMNYVVHSCIPKPSAFYHMSHLVSNLAVNQLVMSEAA